MYKRIWVLILALLLLLCACGNESTDSPGSGRVEQSAQSGAPGEPSQGTPAEPNTITVRVTINPEFTLTLDENMNILSAEAENGVPTRESYVSADGSKTEIAYHSNGNVATYYGTSPDGSTYRVTYNEDGSIASQENG